MSRRPAITRAVPHAAARARPGAPRVEAHARARPAAATCSHRCARSTTRSRTRRIRWCIGNRTPASLRDLPRPWWRDAPPAKAVGPHGEIVDQRAVSTTCSASSTASSSSGWAQEPRPGDLPLFLGRRAARCVRARPRGRRVADRADPAREPRVPRRRGACDPVPARDDRRRPVLDHPRDQLRRGGGRRPLPARRGQPREGGRRGDRAHRGERRRREGVLRRSRPRADRRRRAGAGRGPRAGRRRRRRLAREARHEVPRRARARRSDRRRHARGDRDHRRPGGRRSRGAGRSAWTPSGRHRTGFALAAGAARGHRRRVRSTRWGSRSPTSATYATELHDPEVTEPAGGGDVPDRNYRMLAGLGVVRGELARDEMAAFVRDHGLPGFSPTQGHIASAVPWLPHALARVPRRRAATARCCSPKAACSSGV